MPPRPHSLLDRIVVISSFIFLNCLFVLVNKFLLSGIFVFPFALTCVNFATTGVVIGFYSYINYPSTWSASILNQSWRSLTLLGIFHGLSIGLQNASLVTLEVSTNQVIRATTPVFVTILAILVEGKRYGLISITSICGILLGTALAVWSDPVFVWIGGILAICATILTSFQILTTAIALEKHKVDPLIVSSISSLVSSSVLVPLVIYFEFHRIRFGMSTYFFFALTSLLGVVYNTLVFLIVDRTSSVYASVIGNFKVVILVCVAIPLFATPFTALTLLGIAVTLISFGVYNVDIAIQKKKKAEHVKMGELK